MMKSYLRYGPSHSFGAICSPSANVTFDFSGNLILSAGVEEVCIWNARQASKVAALRPDIANYPYDLPGEVTHIERSTDKTTLAVGYSTGEIRVFNFINKSIVATFKAHRSGVSYLSYDDGNSSSLLASGGKDSDIYIWDMVSMCGVCKLRGHKDVVTSVKFLTKGVQKLLVSVSKDTLLKVWDLSTQYCIQTIVGHRSEIWTMAMFRYPNNHSLLITGSSDSLLRGYAVVMDEEGAEETVHLGDDERVLEHIGCIERQFGLDKCGSIHFNEGGTVIAVQSSGKNVEKAKKKLKRRLKRIREKGSDQESANAMGGSFSVWREEVGEGGEGMKDTEDMNVDRVLLSDLLDKYEVIKCPQRVRACAFSPSVGKDGSDTLLVSLLNNSMELHKVPFREVDDSTAATTTKSSVVELQGHRSDVRAVAVSADGLRVASCSAEGLKVWNVESGACICSSLCGYGVTLAFAPGGRYVLVGTKDGSLQAVDTASGEVIAGEEEAHKGAVWSICVRPDGKGFATSSADALVKFWTFTVSKGTLGIELSKELQMTHDALCVRYSTSKSQDKLLVAVGLLDNTIKVFFDDSLKFFLSLYGHKLPVMCLDISYDNTILISGSADKTIKIWGLDFGDCHRSLIAHADSVTAVRFVPQTHYFFSSGKDGAVKYWDADRFEQILLLPGHCSAVWGLDVSFEGAFCVSAGADRTLRVWRRSEELVFVEEEKERALEAQIDREAERTGGQLQVSSFELTAAATVDSAKGGERLMDAIDLVEAELSKHHAHGGRVSSNPLLLGKPPHRYMVHVLRQIAAHDIEQALLVLPFHYVARFITILIELARHDLDIEVCCRSLVFLLRCHEAAIVSTQTLVNDIADLQLIIRGSLDRVRNLVGTNLAGLKFLSRGAAQAKQGFNEDPVDIAPVSIKKSKVKKNKRKLLA